MKGKIRTTGIWEAPFIQIKAKVVMPGKTNGKPNIDYKEEYVVAPSAKKIAIYIRNQIFGSELVSQTEDMDINWLMPTLSESLERAIYQTESFIYLHKYNNKVYLECLNHNDLHDIEQVFDQVKKATIIQEFETDKNKYELHREITLPGNNTSIIKFTAYIEDNGKLREISIEKFNEVFNTEYERIENKPYEVLINIDTGEDFFKDSKKLLNEEMELINTIASEVEKTKTIIATSEHYASGDIATTWQPKSTTYDPHTLSVGTLQDYFVLMPGDRDHQIFEYLQGEVRIDKYEDTFKFYDYQIIQMAGLSPATFGYEKDAYMNNANVDLSANASEMTIEALKRQLEPQINRLIENIIRLQQSAEIEVNKLPLTIDWDYGANERIDDMKKLDVLQDIQRAMSVPYGIRADIVLPILNKLVDEPIEREKLVKEWQEESNKMNIEFGEL
jgi:hypothetical protein